MDTIVFTGRHYERRVVRRFVTTDPGTGQRITQTVRLDDLTDFVATRMTGFGPSESGELQITLQGQSEAFKPKRITAAAQNAEVLRSWLKEHDFIDPASVQVDATTGKLKTAVTLKKPVVFSHVMGVPMQTFSANRREVVDSGGFVIHELYAPDNKPIIGAPANTEKGEAAAGLSF